jgi:hypothetical protein
MKKTLSVSDVIVGHVIASYQALTELRMNASKSNWAGMHEVGGFYISWRSTNLAIKGQFI